MDNSVPVAKKEILVNYDNAEPRFAYLVKGHKGKSKRSLKQISQENPLKPATYTPTFTSDGKNYQRPNSSKRSLAAALAASDWRKSDSEQSIEAVAATKIADPEQRRHAANIAARTGKRNLTQALFHPSDYQGKFSSEHPLIRSFRQLKEGGGTALDISNQLIAQDPEESQTAIAIALKKLRPKAMNPVHSSLIHVNTDFSEKESDDPIFIYHNLSSRLEGESEANKLRAFLNLASCKTDETRQGYFKTLRTKIDSSLWGLGNHPTNELINSPQRLTSVLKDLNNQNLLILLEQDFNGRSPIFSFFTADPLTSLELIEKLGKADETGVSKQLLEEGAREKELVNSALTHKDSKVKNKILEILKESEASIVTELLKEPSTIEKFLQLRSTSETELEKFFNILENLEYENLNSIFDLDSDSNFPNTAEQIFASPHISPNSKSEILRIISSKRPKEAKSIFTRKGLDSDILALSTGLYPEGISSEERKELVSLEKLALTKFSEMNEANEELLKNPENTKAILKRVLKNGENKDQATEIINTLINQADGKNSEAIAKAIPYKEVFAYKNNPDSKFRLIEKIAHLPGIQTAELQEQGFYEALSRMIGRYIRSSSESEKITTLLKIDNIAWDKVLAPLDLKLTGDVYEKTRNALYDSGWLPADKD